MSNIIELIDELNECRSKISLISDLFSQQTHFEFSDHSQVGLSFILRDLINSIDRVGHRMQSINKERSIKQDVPF